jgi:hypothetical protein
MVIMTNDEILSAITVWPANVKQPIDRDIQIQLMTTAKERHKSVINILIKQLEDERKGQ